MEIKPEIKITELGNNERPREKILAKGVSCLSDVELLAVLLGAGGKGVDVLSLARQILPIIDQKNGGLKPQDLMGVKGLGEAKACMIAASYEFSRRRIRPCGVKVRQPADILPLVSHLAGRQQEHFISVSLNGAHEVIATRVVTIGLVNSSQIHPREVFSESITDRASAIIVAHNHPSGQLNPSDEDRAVTARLKSTGEIIGIHLLDHLIFSSTGHFSFREQGLI